MKESELLGYTAGILDGDGYSSIMRTKTSRGNRYQPKIGAMQLWPGPALRLLHECFGGTFYGPTYGGGIRPMARWEIWDGRAAAIVERLLPSLRVKRRQGELLLHAHHLLLRGRMRNPDLNEVGAIRTAIMALNKGNPANGSAYQGQTVAPDPGLVPGSSQPAEAVLAYLAGIVDSDGNLKIERRTSVKGMLNPHFRIAIRASQVAPSPAIELLAEVFGGTVRGRDSGGGGYRPLAYWSLHDRSAVPAIEALLPYLVTKAPEAALLLRLRQLKDAGKEGLTEHVHANRWHPKVVMRKRCYSADQVRAFDRLYLTLRALHSGVEPLALPGFPVPKRGRLKPEDVTFLRSAR